MQIVTKTERLIIRRWQQDEVEAFKSVFGDPEMYRYLPGNPMTSDDDARDTLARIIARNEQWPGMGSFAAFDRNLGQTIGNAMIRPLEGGPEIEVGYHVARPLWRQGYATEIARGMVRYGFEALGLDEIQGVVVPDNIGSVRALQNAGLRKIERTRVYDLDCIRLAITRAEFETIQATTAPGS